MKTKQNVISDVTCCCENIVNHIGQFSEDYGNDLDMDITIKIRANAVPTVEYKKNVIPVEMWKRK